MDRSISIFSDLLRLITLHRPHPRLPKSLFLAGTYFYPQINVELIVRIDCAYVLYAWRDDSFGNRGWHLPGSIIRPNETIEQRITECLYGECNFLDGISFDYFQVGISEVIEPRPGIRSHFISLVYVVDIPFRLDDLDYLDKTFCISNKSPDHLIKNHQRYRSLLDKIDVVTPSNYIVFY